MNKFDGYIYEYLLQHKELSLENTGRFFTGALPDGVEGNITSVPGGFGFLFDKRISTDDAFIDFLASKTGKPRSLVLSDFSSYLEQMRSFINIGKAYEIPGIGVLKSGGGGQYELSASEKKPELSKTPKATAQRESRRPRNNGLSAVLKFITGLVVLAVLAGLGWGAWSMFIKNSNWAEDSNNTVKQDGTDTAGNVQGAPVSASDSGTALIPVNPSDTIKCLYVQEVTRSLLRAKTRTAKLNDFGYNSGFDSTGGYGYRIFTIHSSLAKDTAYMRDSLQKNFQKKIFVEMIKN